MCQNAAKLFEVYHRDYPVVHLYPTINNNDLPNVISHPTVLFADDATVVFSGKNKVEVEKELNDNLITIIDWLKNSEK